MKFVSWNVNGIRAVIKKDFFNFFNNISADIYCLQETKIHSESLTDEIKQMGALHGYNSYWSGANKKGYSGVATITKIKPLSVIKGIGNKIFDDEGRILTLEFEKYYLINVYVPNSKRTLERLDEKIEFNKLFIDFCEKLRKNKPIIFCGDLNVAHKEIDIKNAKSNIKNAGFTIEERNAFQKQLDKGYIDTFRLFNQKEDNYTWWSYMNNARERNIGWRIDYFIVSSELKNKIINAGIMNEVFGSDHCPVWIEIKE